MLRSTSTGSPHTGRNTSTEGYTPVAAQRDPGRAEVEVHRTVSTNVLGTRTVLTTAAEAGVPQVVCASTSKALRPYSPDMYTASKRAGEWVASGVAAASGMLISAGRFTMSWTTRSSMRGCWAGRMNRKTA